jgi:putative DNA primase/helicase
MIGAAAMAQGAAQPLILEGKTAAERARLFMSAHYFDQRLKVPTLAFWCDNFWAWTGKKWQLLESIAVRQEMLLFLEGGTKMSGGPLQPRTFEVDNALKELKSIRYLPAEISQPSWIGGNCPFKEINEVIACQNGLLDLQTRQLHDHTSQFWSANVVDYKYDASADAPQFQQFLDDILPVDDEGQLSVLEMFGYALVDDSRYQKGFQIIGPPRAGKGILAAVLRGLVGSAAFVGTSMQTFSGRFGMEGLIGKKAVVITDARLKGLRAEARNNFLTRSLTLTTGEDQSVEQKNAKDHQARLTVKPIMLSNEPIFTPDASGAFATRWIYIEFRRSFLGKEDRNLEKKLLGELPGILNMVLNALDWLRQRGDLLQPESGMELMKKVSGETSHYKIFAEEFGEFGENASMAKMRVYRYYRGWCKMKGRRYVVSENEFISEFQAAFPNIGETRPRALEGNREVRRHHFMGFRIDPDKVEECWRQRGWFDWELQNLVKQDKGG